MNNTRLLLAAADVGPNDIKACGAENAELLITVEAQDPNAKGSPPLPKFSMAAYNGGPMKVSGWRYPVVVDISGLSVPAKSIPIRLQHDPMHGVGHTTEIDVNQNTRVTVKGLISRSTPAAQEVTASGKSGFPWQASIGASVIETEWIPEDKSARVNGRTFQGPLTVARKSSLNEISFVDLGADTTSSANVAAAKPQSQEKVPMNEFEKWLEAKGFKKADLEAAKLAELQAEFDSEQKALKAKADADALKTAQGDITSQIRAAAAAEMSRIAGVRKACGSNEVLAAKAISEGWSEEKGELEAMRAERKAWSDKAPNAIIAGSDNSFDEKIIEAAIFQNASNSQERERFKDAYDDKTMQAAHTRFRGRLGLQQLLLEAAWASGKFHGRSFDGYYTEVLNAAFSTLSLPGILSNNLNKFLMDSFNAIETSWRKVAAIRNVRDFKQASSYRLGGAMEYSKVGPHGELKSVQPAEVKYTNQADTYGAILGVSRQDIINDDLGALAAAPRRLGRGAALKFNKIFWTAFMSNPSNFFGTGNKNYLSGAGSAFQYSALQTALTTFRNQTDPDGEPLGYAPKVLLVPNALEVVAINLMRSQELRDSTASTKVGTSNAAFAGRYDPVQSSYLSNSTITNNSTTAWWLLADPMDLAVIEACFLNGQESPVVESSEAEFDTLGIRFRAFHDFGVNLQEFRAGVMNAGA